MDNKITKNRLSNFLSYEWILLIIISVVAIIVWELVYTMTAVRLTPGQQFKFYYDEELDKTGHDEFYQLLVNKDTFSYDVLQLSSEDLESSYNVLSARLSVQEGDMIITSIAEKKSEGDDQAAATVRAKSIIDGIGDGIKEVYTCLSLDDLLGEAKTYLKAFLKDGITEENAELNFENLDQNKIRAHFLMRMDGDNRFRKEDQKEQGVKDECARLKRLCEDTVVFKYYLDNASDDAFFRYTRYEQTYNNGDDKVKESYRTVYEKEQAERNNLRYGLNAAALRGGKTDPSEYFKLLGAEDAANVTILTFDMLKYQPDLQFECISVYSAIIRECSNIVPQSN